MGTPATDMIDAWLNEAALGPYRIEAQWTPLHAEALVERIHDAVTSPSSAILTSLGLLLTMAERNATEGVAPGPDGMEVQSAVGLAQLSMARQLVDAMNLQTKARAFTNALLAPDDRVMLAAVFDARTQGGITRTQLRTLNITDVFTMRRRLDRLVDEVVLQTRGDGADAQYVFSEKATYEWEGYHAAKAVRSETV